MKYVNADGCTTCIPNRVLWFTPSDLKEHHLRTYPHATVSPWSTWEVVTTLDENYAKQPLLFNEKPMYARDRNLKCTLCFVFDASCGGEGTWRIANLSTIPPDGTHPNEVDHWDNLRVPSFAQATNLPPEGIWRGNEHVCPQCLVHDW